MALDLALPVFDLNGIALKDALHNRHHVGDAAHEVAFSRNLNDLTDA